MTYNIKNIKGTWDNKKVLFLIPVVNVFQLPTEMKAISIKQVDHHDSYKKGIRMAMRLLKLWQIIHAVYKFYRGVETCNMDKNGNVEYKSIIIFSFTLLPCFYSFISHTS